MKNFRECVTVLALVAAAVAGCDPYTLGAACASDADCLNGQVCDPEDPDAGPNGCVDAGNGTGADTCEADGSGFCPGGEFCFSGECPETNAESPFCDFEDGEEDCAQFGAGSFCNFYPAIHPQFGPDVQACSGVINDEGCNVRNGAPFPQLAPADTPGNVCGEGRFCNVGGCLSTAQFGGCDTDADCGASGSCVDEVCS